LFVNQVIKPINTSFLPNFHQQNNLSSSTGMNDKYTTNLITSLVFNKLGQSILSVNQIINPSTPHFQPNSNNKTTSVVAQG